MLKLHPGLLCSVMVCVSGLSFPASVVAQSTSLPATNRSESAVTLAAVSELPDSPGTIWEQSQQSPQQNTSEQSPNPQAESQTSEKPADKRQRPVGTAAAEAPKVSGITAAQPSGVALAPAKQRRVRILVLKVGAIIGAGAAVGTVIALTAATPSKPPGAH